MNTNHNHNSHNHRNNNQGIGIEMEGFIVNAERPQERIEGLPASQWIIREFGRKFPDLADRVSPEQASVMLEIKTGVHQSEEEAVAELFKIRALINQCLGPQGCQMIFQPVSKQRFDFVPADLSEGSRSRQLVEAWSRTDQGSRLLFKTATASFQINDSRIPDPPKNGDILAFAARVHNLFTANRDFLTGQNSGITDWEGKTRLEQAIDLLSSVKARQFEKRGLPAIESPLPRPFASTEDFAAWSCAHSDVDEIGQADPKNEHAVTVKVKRTGPVIVETRIFDAVEDPQIIRHLIRINSQLLAQL